MSNGREVRIPLAGYLGLKDAKSVCDSLREAVGAFDSIEIDASDLTGIDISVVQLLIAAHKSTERQGKTLTLVADPAGPLQTTLAVAGLLAPDGALWLGEERSERQVES